MFVWAALLAVVAAQVYDGVGVVSWLPLEEACFAGVATPGSQTINTTVSYFASEIPAVDPIQVLETCPGNDTVCNSATVEPVAFVCHALDFTLVQRVTWCSSPHPNAGFHVPPDASISPAVSTFIPPPTGIDALQCEWNTRNFDTPGVSIQRLHPPPIGAIVTPEGVFVTETPALRMDAPGDVLPSARYVNASLGPWGDAPGIGDTDIWALNVPGKPFTSVGVPSPVAVHPDTVLVRASSHSIPIADVIHFCQTTPACRSVTWDDVAITAVTTATSGDAVTMCSPSGTVAACRRIDDTNQTTCSNAATCTCDVGYAHVDGECLPCDRPQFIEDVAETNGTWSRQSGACVPTVGSAFVDTACGGGGVVNTTSPLSFQGDVVDDFRCTCPGVLADVGQRCECTPDSCHHTGTCSNDTIPVCLCDPGYTHAVPGDPSSHCTDCLPGFFVPSAFGVAGGTHVDGACLPLADICPGAHLLEAASEAASKCIYFLPNDAHDACFAEHGEYVTGDGLVPCPHPVPRCGATVDVNASLAEGRCVCNGASRQNDCRVDVAGEACPHGAQWSTVGGPYDPGCTCVDGDGVCVPRLGDDAVTCITDEYELMDGGTTCSLRRTRVGLETCGRFGYTNYGVDDPRLDVTWSCGCVPRGRKTTPGSQEPCDGCAFSHVMHDEDCVPCPSHCATLEHAPSCDGDATCTACTVLFGKPDLPDGSCGDCPIGSASLGGHCVPCPGGAWNALVCDCKPGGGNETAVWVPLDPEVNGVDPVTGECSVCVSGVMINSTCVPCDCPPGIPCTQHNGSPVCDCGAGFRVVAEDSPGACGDCLPQFQNIDEVCVDCDTGGCHPSFVTCDHGVFIEEGCVCSPGFTGVDCDHCLPWYIRVGDDCVPCPAACPMGCTTPTECDCGAANRVGAENGTCGACVPGFAGEGCDAPCPSGCHGFGECVWNGTHGVCDCAPGHVGAACEACTPETHVASSSGACLPCPTHCDFDAPCVAASGDAICSCPDVGRRQNTATTCFVDCHPPLTGRNCDIVPPHAFGITEAGCPLDCGEGGMCVSGSCLCSWGFQLSEEGCSPCPGCDGECDTTLVNPGSCAVCTPPCHDGLVCGATGTCTVAGVFTPFQAQAPVATLVLGDPETESSSSPIVIAAVAISLPVLSVLLLSWAVSWAIVVVHRPGTKAHTD